MRRERGGARWVVRHYRRAYTAMKKGMNIFLDVSGLRHDEWARVHSYSFNGEEDLHIRLQTRTGQMDIRACELPALVRALEIFRLGELK
jgi:hypothetical protein